jgi:hypothetical protein
MGPDRAEDKANQDTPSRSFRQGPKPFTADSPAPGSYLPPHPIRNRATGETIEPKSSIVWARHRLLQLTGDRLRASRLHAS